MLTVAVNYPLSFELSELIIIVYNPTKEWLILYFTNYCRLCGIFSLALYS